MKNRCVGARWVSTIFCLALVAGTMFPASSTSAWSWASSEIDSLDLTPEEREYIAQNPHIKALIVVGAAPIQYLDKDGAVQGISIMVLEEIAAATGLRFNYEAFDSLEQLNEAAQDGDIVVGIPTAYEGVIPNLVRSQPYLESYTIQYQHTSVDTEHLDGKIFAAVEGGSLPPGVLPENVRYFDTREAAIEAVNAGKADYGYGNAYSISYYALQNRYKNLVVIPLTKETRDYSLAPINPDPLLMSILNKAIAAIDHNTMLALIINATTQIDQEVTLAMVLESYRGLVWTVFLVIIALLLLWIITHHRSRKELELQNRRYEMLAELSREFIFQYRPDTDTLVFSQYSLNFFGDSAASISEAIRTNLADRQHHEGEGTSVNTLAVPPMACQAGVFRLITGNVYTSDGQLREIIGKLIDISQETAEKEALVTRAQLDGLTGVFNVTTLRELVEERLKKKNTGAVDAFVLLDADSFKDVNDNLGHYTGDQVLIDIAKAMKSIFRATDIIGRFGGDEFCVYMKNVPSPEFVATKCHQLVESIHCNLDGVTVSACVGAALVANRPAYKEIFQAADAALYQAKAQGPGQIVVVENYGQ